jgi:hypothetical protein
LPDPPKSAGCDRTTASSRTTKNCSWGFTVKSYSSQAAQVLENEAWNEAFTQLDASLHSSWAHTSPDEWKKREQIYERIQALQDVRNKLETFLATGALDQNPAWR